MEQQILNIYKNLEEDIVKIEKKELCDGCNKDNIIHDAQQGVMVCRECGMISKNLYDYNPEWNNFDDKTDNSRCSNPLNILLPHTSFSIRIGGFSKINTFNIWYSIPNRERSLAKVFSNIQNRCQKGKILSCIELDAKIMYKMISECTHASGKKVIKRGKVRKSVIAACVYYACKKKDMSRSKKEIAILFDIEITKLSNGIKKFDQLISYDSLLQHKEQSQIEHYILRFSNNLNIDNIYIDDAIKIVNNIKKINIIPTHIPLGIALACILIISEKNKLKITKKILSIKYYMSEATINKSFKEIKKYYDVLINDTHIKNISDKINGYIEYRKKNISENIKKRALKFNIIM
jgi:transcription initiation factor TFIIB